MSTPEVDLAQVRTVPFAGRGNKVAPGQLAAPPADDRSVTAFLESLPDLLAARQLRQVIDHVVSAHRRGRGVVVLIGGHVIKTGLAPLLIDLIDRGVISHVAMNGAASIHDFELTRFGGTSEDVEAGLGDGSFGMVAETGAEMNAAISSAAEQGRGLGEGLAIALRAADGLVAPETSLLLGCQRAGIGVTVHAAVGADIIHQQPGFDGGALGETSARDFRRLAAALAALHDGGAVLNIGSAVMMPEVFLKALTVARNLHAGQPTGFLAADFDMIRHYRPRLNVVDRPTRGHGIGIQLTGHHEIMIPLLTWGIVTALEREPRP